jgi:DNA polymerase sigma
LCRLRHARYPLITMMHKQSGIDIQVVCSNDTSASRDIIKRYIDADPTLFSLYAVSKVMFDLRGLSDVFRGGLGSYSLFMMIVVALKLKEVRKDAPLGEKLLAILEFYSVYDPYKDALAIEPPSIHPKIRLEHQISEEEKQRMVEDPVSTSMHFSLPNLTGGHRYLRVGIVSA